MINKLVDGQIFLRRCLQLLLYIEKLLNWFLTSKIFYFYEIFLDWNSNIGLKYYDTRFIEILLKLLLIFRLN